jgi:hypothetical protein
MAPRHFNLGTRWRWVVSFTPRKLYVWVNDHQCPPDWLGGLQNRSRQNVEESSATLTEMFCLHRFSYYPYASPVLIVDITGRVTLSAEHTRYAESQDCSLIRNQLHNTRVKA